MSNTEKLKLVPEKRYQLDTSKIKTVKDVVTILELLQITFTEGYEKFDKIKPYLKDYEQ